MRLTLWNLVILDLTPGRPAEETIREEINRRWFTSVLDVSPFWDGKGR